MENQPDKIPEDNKSDNLFAEYLETCDSSQSATINYIEDVSEISDLIQAHTALKEFFSPLTPRIINESLQQIKPGTKINNYEVMNEIGRHGQGVVYKVKNLKLNRIEAMKMLLLGHNATEEELARFDLEITSHALMDHPNIVPIYGSGEFQGQLYFTMKFLEDGDLSHSQKLYPSLTDSVHLIRKVANSIHYAHQRQILHRDLKPSNILLDNTEPFVADFGLAKVIESDSTIPSSYIVGAPSYMPPEQIDGESTVLSDVYGIGAIFYWQLTGKPPHKGKNPLDTLQSVKEEQVIPPHHLKSELSNWRNHLLELICLKCINKKPEQRYQSADSMAIDLKRWLEVKPPLQIPVNKLDRFRLWRLRNPVLSLFIFIMTLMILLASVAAINISTLHLNGLNETLSELTIHGVKESKDIELLQDKIVSLSTDKHLIDHLKQSNVSEFQNFCDNKKNEFEKKDFSIVESVFIVGNNKKIIADSKVAGIGKLVEERDYVKWTFGKDRLEEEFFISEVYKAKSDGLYKFAIVSRIISDQTTIGLIGISIASEGSRTWKLQENLVDSILVWMGIIFAPILIFLIILVIRLFRRGLEST